MNQRTTYLQYLIVAARVLLLLGCHKNDEPTTSVPPQTTESEPVSLTVSLGMLTRATGLETGSYGVKTRWEQGDKMYFGYIKTFATDQEIMNVFTVETIDATNPGSALFTCPKFIMPRGIEEGKLIYVGKENMGKQLQNGNNSLDNIGNYLQMESGWFAATTPAHIAQKTPVMKHACSLVTLQIKRPEGWTDNLLEVILALSSNNVTLLGTEDNRIVLTLENVEWNEDRATVHFIVCMAGIVNTGNTWTVEVKGEDVSNKFNVTYPAKQLNNGGHYTSLISSDPSDYETPVYIEVPGFEDAGSAF
jgi:hypothetical protein